MNMRCRYEFDGDELDGDELDGVGLVNFPCQDNNQINTGVHLNPVTESLLMLIVSKLVLRCF